MSWRAAALQCAVWAIGVLAIAAYIGLLAFHRAGPSSIHGDGISYYIYLPAWVGDRDPTFETAARDCCGGFLADPIGLHRWPETGRWLDVHPVGVALLLLPFYLVAHALTWWSNLPPDGFSPYFQFIVPLAGPAALIAGLAALQRLLRRHFSDGVVLATLVAMTFGTNLFHYAVFEGTYSHVYSFCLLAWLLVCTADWWERPSWPRSIGLSVILALIFMVRHPNAVFVAVLPCYGVGGPTTLATRARELWSRRGRLCAIAMMTLIGSMPQLAIYRWATGHWFVSSYPGGYFTFASPHLFGTLFSVERGVFFWSPILLVAVIGMAWARGWAKGLVAVTATVLVVHTYLLASWYFWDLGVGYGHRGYVDVLPLLAIFVAVFFARLAEQPRLGRPLAALATLLVLLAAVQMVQYLGRRDSRRAPDLGTVSRLVSSLLMTRRRFVWIVIVLAGAAAALAYLRDPRWVGDVTAGLQPWSVDSDHQRVRWTTGRASFYVPSGATQMTLPFRAIEPRSDRPVTIDVSVDDRWLATVDIPDRPKPQSLEWVTTTLPLPQRATGRRFRRVDLRVHRWLPELHAGVQMGEITLGGK